MFIGEKGQQTKAFDDIYTATHLLSRLSVSMETWLQAISCKNLWFSIFFDWILKNRGNSLPCGGDDIKKLGILSPGGGYGMYVIVGNCSGFVMILNIEKSCLWESQPILFRLLDKTVLINHCSPNIMSHFKMKVYVMWFKAKLK